MSKRTARAERKIRQASLCLLIGGIPYFLLVLFFCWWFSHDPQIQAFLREPSIPTMRIASIGVLFLATLAMNFLIWVSALGLRLKQEWAYWIASCVFALFKPGILGTVLIILALATKLPRLAEQVAQQPEFLGILVLIICIPVLFTVLGHIGLKHLDDPDVRF